MERRPCRCGDRPGGWVPAGMSRNHAPSGKERQYCTPSRRVAQEGAKNMKPAPFGEAGKMARLLRCQMLLEWIDRLDPAIDLSVIQILGQDLVASDELGSRKH